MKRPKINDVASKLKIVSEPARLSVLEELRDGVKTAGTLSNTLNIEPSLLSHHLRVLRENKLVASQRHGREVHYELADNVMITNAPDGGINLGVCEILFGTPYSGKGSKGGRGSKRR